MCAQRKPAVKDTKEQSTAKSTQTVSKQVRSAGTTEKQPAPSQPKRQEKEKEKSVLAQRGERVAQMVRDTRSEMKKVSWPDKETTRNLTLLVIGMTTALGLLLGGIDFVLLKLFEWI